MHLPSNRPIEEGQPLPPVPAYLQQLAGEQLACEGQPSAHFRPTPHYLNRWAVHIQTQQAIIWHRATDVHQLSRFRARWEALYAQSVAVLELLEAAFALDSEAGEPVWQRRYQLRGLELWGELYPAVGELAAPAITAAAAATQARNEYLATYYALLKEEQQYQPAHVTRAA